MSQSDLVFQMTQLSLAHLFRRPETYLKVSTHNISIVSQSCTLCIVFFGIKPCFVQIVHPFNCKRSIETQFICFIARLLRDKRQNVGADTLHHRASDHSWLVLMGASPIRKRPILLIFRDSSCNDPTVNVKSFNECSFTNSKFLALAEYQILTIDDRR